MLFSCDRVPDLRLSLNESLHMVHREDWNTVARAQVYLAALTCWPWRIVWVPTWSSAM